MSAPSRRLSRVIAAAFPGASNAGLRRHVRIAFGRAPEGTSDADVICTPVEGRIALSTRGRVSLRHLVAGVLDGSIPALWDLASDGSVQS